MILLRINALPDELRNINDIMYPLYMVDSLGGYTWLKIHPSMKISQVEDFIEELRSDYLDVDVIQQF